MINFLKLWNLSANEYHKYALKYPQYKKTNEKLIELSKIKSETIILDLACGTGLTTKEILNKNPNINKIYLNDFSENMINIAKKHIQSNKVKYIISNAEDIDKFIFEKIDLIVCNSAFWQFENPDKVLKSLNNILKSNGKIIFNLNQQFFNFENNENSQKIIIESIFTEMKKKGYQSKNKLKTKINKGEIEKIFKENNFILKKTKIINIGPRKLDDFFEFLTIPATATFFENIKKEEQNKILNSSYNKLKNEIKEIKNNQWIYFIFQKL